MKVWIHINNVQEGPFSIEELPLQRMSPDTPVWHEGLDDWVEAKDSPLTAPLFTAPVEPIAQEEILKEAEKEIDVVVEDLPQAEIEAREERAAEKELKKLEEEEARKEEELKNEQEEEPKEEAKEIKAQQEETQEIEEKPKGQEQKAEEEEEEVVVLIVKEEEEQIEGPQAEAEQIAEPRKADEQPEEPTKQQQPDEEDAEDPTPSERPIFNGFQQPWQQPQQQPWQQPQQPQPQQQPWQQPQQPQPQQQPWQKQEPCPGRPQGKTPPTYLAWAIVITVLCCNPVAIVALVLALVINSRWSRGDAEGAWRLSRANEWWVIISIVTSLVFWPLSILVAF